MPDTLTSPNEERQPPAHRRLGGRKAQLALIAMAALLLWLYFPPIGSRIDVPHLEPFFEPGVSHGKPVFINTGFHVYYRVRLNRPVEPWFYWTYFQRLRTRGVQFDEIASSRFAPNFRRSGWKMALAREAEIQPYTVQYWKSIDYESGGFPVFMRWPWLYVRLSSSVLQSHTALLVPQQDVTRLAVEIPRYPGSVLQSVNRSGWIVTLEFSVEAPPDEILLFYGHAFGRTRSGGDVRAAIAQGQDTLEFAPGPSLARSLLNPYSGIKDSPAGGFSVEVHNYLYTDHPLVIYPLQRARKIPPHINKQQPEGLKNLPPVSRYRISLRYRTNEDARRALEHLAPSLVQRSQPR